MLHGFPANAASLSAKDEVHSRVRIHRPRQLAHLQHMGGLHCTGEASADAQLQATGRSALAA